MRIAVFSVAAGWCVPIMSYAAEIGQGELRVSRDATTIELPIVLRPGANEVIGALQFDLRFDSNVFELVDVKAGPASKAASKSANFNQYEPGRVRVILAGLNRNAIAAGSVAVLTFRASEGSQAPSGQFRLTSVILSDPFGVEVPSTINPVTTPAGGAGTTTVLNRASEPAPRSIFEWGVVFVVCLGFASLLVYFARPAKNRKAS